MLFEKDIPTDRLIHIMEMARNLSESEWNILINRIDGMEVKQISLTLNTHPNTVRNKLNKIIELIRVAIS